VQDRRPRAASAYVCFQVKNRRRGPVAPTSACDPKL